MPFVAFSSVKPLDSDTDKRSLGSHYPDSLYLQIGDEKDCELEWSATAERRQRLIDDMKTHCRASNIDIDDNMFYGTNIIETAKKIDERFFKRLSEAVVNIYKITPLLVLNKGQRVN